jgi:hypothetical protein
MSFFDGIRFEKVSTTGGECELPLLYHDGGLLTLGWAVDPARARELFDERPDGRAFEPWVIAGRAWALVCAFEYRKTSIGPYGELGIGVLAKRRGSSPSVLRFARDMRKEREAGLFVVNLPVTTDRARRAGRELWGYPKYVEKMQSTFDRDAIRFVLENEFEITIGKPGRVRTRSIPMITWSVTPEGQMRRTIVETGSTIAWGGAGSATIRMIGDGPTAKTVRALGLDAKKPTVAFRTNEFRSILPLGDDVGAVSGWTPPPKEAPAAQPSAE